MRKSYLVLADGSVYEGFGFGAETNAIGELVFTTGVVGYIENLTDPCHAGQIVLQTFPLIGNYGMIEEDLRGEPRVHGYVVREWCDTPSNFRSQYDLDKYLRDHGIPGIYGLDTRALTRKIRECGEMNAMICSEIPDDLSAISAYSFTGAVEKCTCAQPCVHPAAKDTKKRAALVNLGSVHSMIQAFTGRGLEVTELPAGFSAQDILNGGFDALILSDGPGAPAENAAIIEQIALLLGKLPVFGAGLGHLLIALAAGGRVEKMSHGHRGANQPVKDIGGARTYITSQNHAWIADAQSIPGAEMCYKNLNDGSCEGLYYPTLNALGVQFIPEAGCAPQDTTFLYDRFISMMGGDCECR